MAAFGFSDAGFVLITRLESVHEVPSGERASLAPSDRGHCPMRLALSALAMLLAATSGLAAHDWSEPVPVYRSSIVGPAPGPLVIAPIPRGSRHDRPYNWCHARQGRLQEFAARVAHAGRVSQDEMRIAHAMRADVATHCRPLYRVASPRYRIRRPMK